MCRHRRRAPQNRYINRVQPCTAGWLFSLRFQSLVPTRWQVCGYTTTEPAVHICTRSVNGSLSENTCGSNTCSRRWESPKPQCGQPRASYIRIYVPAWHRYGTGTKYGIRVRPSPTGRLRKQRAPFFRESNINRTVAPWSGRKLRGLRK